jgi:hypothetical protein
MVTVNPNHHKRWPVMLPINNDGRDPGKARPNGEIKRHTVLPLISNVDRSIGAEPERAVPNSRSATTGLP